MSMVAMFFAWVAVGCAVLSFGTACVLAYLRDIAGSRSNETHAIGWLIVAALFFLVAK